MNEEIPMTVAQFKAEIVEMQKEFDSKLNERQKRFNFSGTELDEAKLAEVKKQEDTVKFFKALGENKRKTLQSMHEFRAKTLNEGSGSAGGYLVPVEFESSIVKYIEQYNQIRQNSMVLPMSSNSKKLNSLTGEPTVYLPGENAQITGSALTFGEPVLTPKKYAAIVDWSSEVLEDAELQLVNLIAERIARAISKKEQIEFISGATSGSEGLLAVSGVTSRSLASGVGFSGVTWDDLANIIADISEIDEVDAENGKFYMSHSIYNVLRKLKASTGGQYFLPDAPKLNNPPMAWGHEIVICNQMPKLSETAQATKFILFGDLSKHAFIGDRRGITLKVLTEATVGSVNLGEKDAEALRVTKRTAFVTALQNGLGVIASGAA